MQLSNNKLVQRGVDLVMGATNCDAKKAKETLLKYNSVKDAIEAIKN